MMDEYDNQLPFFIPKNVNSLSLDFIKFFPKNLFQLENPENYLINEINDIKSTPYRIAFFKRTDMEEVKKFIKRIKNLKVILLENGKDDYLKSEIERKNDFLTRIVNVDIDEFGENINSFLFNLTLEKNQIFKALKIDNKTDSYLNIKTEISKLQSFDYFTPTKNNYLIYNNIIGNFSFDYDIDENFMLEESKKAIKESKTFNRLNIYLKQIESFDFLTKYYRRSNYPLNYFFELKPITLCLPFNNPDIQDFFQNNKDKDFKRSIASIQVEQTTNYINELETKEDKNYTEEFLLAKAGAQFAKERFQFIDNIGFLTSSFNLSPYVRFPLLGKSVYRELSFIAQKNFHKFLTLKSQNKISDTIFKIGGKISNKILSEEFKKKLSKRNSQIIAISDLPIEWITINKIPLSFTHDITRLPETNYNSLIQSFVFNSSIDFEVKEDIIKRTLVIVGTVDEEFTKWRKILNKSSEENGFIIKTCLTVKDFVKTVNEFKPDFLLIDSHADFDKTKKQTFIKIGKEKLTHDDINNNNIIVPLVFLSACGTSPTYGTFDSIANAFLQMGAKSVTSTYLPIDIDSSTMVYLTILNNLNSVAKKGSFNNWLEYICFNIRSSFLHRTFTSILEDSPEYEKSYYDLIQKILLFKERPKIFNEIQKIENQIPSRIFNQNKSKIYEFLYYTNIGRGDLVLFKKYRENFEKINYS
jgi:hypothetical protein